MPQNNRSHTSTRKKVVSHNNKGGCGKTAIICHLAWHLVKRGYNPDFWDYDDQANGISWLSGHEWQGEDPIRISGPGQNVIRATTHWPEAGLGPPADPAGPLLIDTPPADPVLGRIDSQVPLSSDDVIVCPVNGRFAIDGAIKVAEEAAPIGCQVLGVPNLTDPKRQHATDEIQALEDLREMDETRLEVFEMAIPRNDDYMREAELQGRPVWDIGHGARTYTGKALRALCRKVASMVEPSISPPELGSDSGPGPGKSLSERLWRGI
jgi:cellulose biosynthesis protein BcsQ